jgi:methionyl-tRNA formyltransferase
MKQKHTYIIASEKIWNKGLAEILSARFPSDKWILIHNKTEFNLSAIRKINPDKIFFPHWSYIIPAEIYNNYDCIVFHMTDLPYGRGGSPLQNLIVRGHKTTKISAIKVVKDIDAGPVYLKKPLSLSGTAREIYFLANVIIEQMIFEIIKIKLKPAEQKGKPTFFTRRKPEESNIENLKNIDQVYDFIRMLDADGYPNAYIIKNDLKFEFTHAKLTSDKSIVADVKITKI